MGYIGFMLLSLVEKVYFDLAFSFRTEFGCGDPFPMKKTAFVSALGE